MNFPSKARYLWATHSACYNPANRLKMQEMAVLEGLDFTNSSTPAKGHTPSSKSCPTSPPKVQHPISQCAPGRSRISPTQIGKSHSWCEKTELMVFERRLRRSEELAKQSAWRSAKIFKWHCWNLTRGHPICPTSTICHSAEKKLQTKQW